MYDLFPGPIRYELPPADSTGDVFGNASHCNVATAAFYPGTKVAYYDKVMGGWSILAYLRYSAGSGIVTAADGQLASPGLNDVTSSTVLPYTVTCDGDSASQTYSYAAVMCVSMTDTYYGWFWVGGFCPYEKAPNLAATAAGIGNCTAGTPVMITATDDVAAGEALTLVDAGNNIGFDNVGTLTTTVVGIALHADVDV